MMIDIFNNPLKPFYRFGDIMLLQKITEKKWITFLLKSYQRSGKTADEKTVQVIPKLMKNHSWYVQQLAHYTWNISHKKITPYDIAAALNELISANTPLYQKEIESISSTQLNLLKAIAGNETKFTSTPVMNKYMLGTPRNVSKNKSILIYNDIIHELNGIFEFVDPAFELWFKKQYFRQPYSS